MRKWVGCRQNKAGGGPDPCGGGGLAVRGPRSQRVWNPLHHKDHSGRRFLCGAAWTKAEGRALPWEGRTASTWVDKGPSRRLTHINWGEHASSSAVLQARLHWAPPCGRLEGGRPAGEGPPLAQPAVSLTWRPHNPSPKPPVPSRPGTEGHLLRHRAFPAAAARPAHTSSPCVTQEAACFDKTEQQAGKSDKLGCTKAFPLPHSSPTRASGLAWKDRGHIGSARVACHPSGSVTAGGVATLGWATCQTGHGTCSLLFCLNTLQRFLSGP